MSIASYIREVGSPNHHLAMRDLRPLSGLDFNRYDEFFPAWQSIQSQRRNEIVRAMVELSEDNVDLDFNTILYWLLDDTDAAVRVAAVEGLWENESPRMLRRLLEMIKNDPSVEVRTAVAISLSHFVYLSILQEVPEADGAALERVLTEIVLDPNQHLEVRRRALEAAGYFSGLNDAVALEIERCYASDEQLLRESALVAMGRSMQERWLPTIQSALDHVSPALRYEAARAAGEMGEYGKPLVPRLVKLADDEDSEIALAAIWALGQVGGDAARRTLKRLCKHTDPTRSQAAEEALGELTLDESLFG